MSENKQYILIPFEEGNLIFKDDGREFFNSVDCLKDNEIVDLLNEQDKTIKKLEKDVDYWKQVASQYSNELNVFGHCKKYKTKCKDIYWSSDVE